MERLTRGRWLNDEIITAILAHAAAAAPSATSLVLTPYQLCPEATSALHSFRSLLESAKADAVASNVRHILAIVNLGGSHWVAFRLVLQPPGETHSGPSHSEYRASNPQPRQRHRYELFDSCRPTPLAWQQEIRDMASRIITRFLPPPYPRLDGWEFVRNPLPCAQQTNTEARDSGIYALVTAWHLLFGRSPPTQLHLPIWRAVFAALGQPVIGGNIERHLPSTITVDLEEGAKSFAAIRHLNETSQHQPRDQEANLTFHNTTLPLFLQITKSSECCVAAK